MKKITQLFLLLVVVFVTACNNTPKIVYLTDYLAKDQMEIDAMPAIREALDYCREVKAEKLVLPKGTLCIKADKAYEKYQFISNNDESLKRIAFELEGMQNFTVEGQDTKLLFTGFVSAFSLENCKNVRIEGLSIDYTRTFHSEGIIEAAGNGYLDIRFPDEYRCNITNGCLYFSDENGIVYDFSNLLEFDTEKKEPAYLAVSYTHLVSQRNIIYRGADIINYYQIFYDETIGSGVAKNNGDALHYTFLRIKDKYGWDVYKKAFRTLYAIKDADLPEMKSSYEKFLYFLSHVSTAAGEEDVYKRQQEEMREMIRHERKIELCYECQRFFDVRRWFIAHGPNGAFNHNEYGLDMSKGENATDKEFFSMTDVYKRQVFCRCGDSFNAFQ